MKRKHTHLEDAITAAKRRYLREQNQRYTDHLEPVPATEWPQGYGETAKTRTEAVWRSRHFLVQIVWEKPTGCRRLTVNRAQLNTSGSGWEDKITWDELMQIKSQVGYPDRWAVEIYPPEAQTVNVANMRHLWLLEEAPPQAWKKPLSCPAL